MLLSLFSISQGHDDIINDIIICQQYKNTKMLKINPDLVKRIQQVMISNPKADEDEIVDKISGNNTIRMKKESIKLGVKQFLKNKHRKAEEASKFKQEDTKIGVKEGIQPIKKVKKSQNYDIEFEDHPTYRFQFMGGISQVFEDISNNIFIPIQKKADLAHLGIRPYKGFLIAGPVGSGKTLLSNCILSYLVNNYGYSALSIHSSIITSSNDAEQKIKKLFETAKETQPTAIFIDDLDFICSKENSKRPQGSPLFSLLVEIDKTKQLDVILIGSTSNPQKIDVSLKKIHRFEKILNLNMSGEKAREQILSKILINTRHSLKKEEIAEISVLTPGFMAGDLVMLMKQASIQFLLGNEDLLTYSHVKKSIKFIQPVLKKEGFTDIPQTTLDDIGGLHNLKLQLQKQIIIPMKQQEKFREINFQIQSGGVLLYGPPGCGKTMLAKAIANAVRANFIIVKGPELLNKYVGESEQAVRQVFGRAQRAAPCVIFFDQFDALAPKRSDQGNQVTERVVNTLLTALDGVEERKMVFVIAATNRKDMIDEATLRAGRIQKHLYVPQPTEQERVEILKAITKKMKLSTNVTFEEIGKKTKGFSGADLKFLVKQGTVNAVLQNRNEVNMKDLERALEDLLEAKGKDRLKQRVHEVQLKDDEQNQQFVYHMKEQKRKEEVAVETQGNLRKEKDLFKQFVDFIVKRQERKAKNT